MSHYPTLHPYTRVGFLQDGSGQFWLGHESKYTPETIRYFNDLVEADRIAFEKKEKISYKKMVN